MTRIVFSIVALLVLAYGLFLTFVFGILWSRASRRRKRAAQSENKVPAIRDALVDYLAGSNDKSRVREFMKTNRDDVAKAILDFHGTVGGSARDRLCDLALEFSLIHQWCQDAHSKDQFVRRTAYTRLSFVCAYEPCRRVAGDLLTLALKDNDQEVRLAAARALVQSGTVEEMAQVFNAAVSQSLLVRLLLAEDLRRHGSDLCTRAIPEVLARGNPREIVAALQILVGWERALPITGLHWLLESPSDEVRLEALRLAPLVPLTPENRTAILRSLHEGDSEESTAAALAAGRLRLQEALPALALCLRTGAAELARIAATAMSEMPPKGWQALQQFAGGVGTSALIASAALERGKRKAGVA